MKDPAVLIFFDKWISATNGMKAEFRAWYFDLMIYQYDKGSIPNDIDEVAGICRVRPSEYEVFKSMIETILKGKFKLQEDNTYKNDVVCEILRKREQFKEKRTKSGTIGYIIKASHEIEKLSEKKEIAFKKYLYNLDETELNKLKDKQVLKQVLKQNSKLYINVDVNEDEDIIKDKIEIKKKTPKLFKDSEYYDINVLSEALSKSKPPYTEAHVGYYYESMDLWSKQGNKKIDWFATCQNFILSDITNNKFKDKNFKPQQNGKSNNGLTEIQKRRAELEQELANKT